MLWIFIAIIVILVIFKFSSSLKEDKVEMRNQKLSDRFGLIVGMLNDFAFHGSGSIIVEDERNFNLWEENSNQIIYFQYSTGSLTIKWKYKYFHNEIIFDKNFDDVRKISIEEQKSIGNFMIKEMSTKIENHKRNISEQNKAPDFNISPKHKKLEPEVLQKYFEEQLKDTVRQAYSTSEYYPETIIRMATLGAAVGLRDELKAQSNVKKHFEGSGCEFNFLPDEYEKILEKSFKVTSNWAIETYAPINSNTEVLNHLHKEIEGTVRDSFTLVNEKLKGAPNRVTQDVYSFYFNKLSNDLTVELKDKYWDIFEPIQSEIDGMYFSKKDYDKIVDDVLQKVLLEFTSL